MNEALGVPSDGKIDKELVIKRLALIRNKLTWLEEMYYNYREDMESAIQDVKYQLDKLSSLIGEGGTIYD